MRELTVLPQLEFTEALKAFWNKIAQFQGRSRRSEFWWTYLAYFVTSIIFSFVPIIGNIVTLLFGLAIIPITFRRLHDTGRSGWWYGVSIIGSLVFTVYLIIQIIIIGTTSLSTDMSEFSSMSDTEIIGDMLASATISYILFGLLVGIVYNIIVLVFLCQDSQKGENKYGPSPKYVDVDADSYGQDHICRQLFNE